MLFLQNVIWLLILKFLDNMLIMPSSDMDINCFVHVDLPTKAQIFKRVGSHGVAPAGAYTQDENFDINPTTIEQCHKLAAIAENLPEDGKEPA